ncbi:hypothetical protein C0Q70_14088 [Pomacea canaliculata]|uniref:Uncharacterized protein n=1 Tax=Pomacea canaliculata TaxID=400727 RepID=A0A2T7NZ19_POMCA|nr:hypothetical protein C0Q70_14088 [Pomacea canaliculata]
MAGLCRIDPVGRQPQCPAWMGAGGGAVLGESLPADEPGVAPASVVVSLKQSPFVSVTCPCHEEKVSNSRKNMLTPEYRLAARYLTMRQTTAADSDQESCSSTSTIHLAENRKNIPSLLIHPPTPQKKKKADVELTITPTTTPVPEVEVILATAPPKKLANCRQETHARETF